jgi:hypothetical protein
VLERVNLVRDPVEPAHRDPLLNGSRADGQ